MLLVISEWCTFSSKQTHSKSQNPPRLSSKHSLTCLWGYYLEDGLCSNQCSHGINELYYVQWQGAVMVFYCTLHDVPVQHDKKCPFLPDIIFCFVWFLYKKQPISNTVDKHHGDCSYMSRIIYFCLESETSINNSNQIIQWTVRCGLRAARIRILFQEAFVQISSVMNKRLLHLLIK